MMQTRMGAEQLVKLASGHYRSAYCGHINGILYHFDVPQLALAHCHPPVSGGDISVSSVADQAERLDMIT
jgi:hypothetical protein